MAKLHILSPLTFTCIIIISHTVHGGLIQVESHEHEIMQEMDINDGTSYYYTFHNFENGIGEGGTFLNSMHGSHGIVEAEITPFSLSNIAFPEIGDYYAASNATASWTFTTNSSLIELTIEEEAKCQFESGVYQAELSWNIYDITTSTIIGQNSHYWYMEYVDYSHSVDYSFTVDPTHTFQLILSSEQGTHEWAETHSSITVSFQSTSVPECSMVPMLGIGLLVLSMFAYYKHGYKFYMNF